MSEVDTHKSTVDQYKRRTYAEMADAQNTGTDVVQGSNLIEDKDTLQGVPFVITKLVFRPSTMTEKEYVSVEAITEDDETIVFNDGSTGIRRQLLNYCIAKEWAIPNVIGEDEDKKIYADGDSPVSDFDFNRPFEVVFNADGLPVASVECQLHAPRGLRISTYDWENPETGKKQKAHTYYLA